VPPRTATHPMQQGRYRQLCGLLRAEAGAGPLP
jgi:hypothetical protein